VTAGSLADPATYADGAPHALFARLRQTLNRQYAKAR